MPSCMISIFTNNLEKNNGALIRASLSGILNAYYCKAEAIFAVGFMIAYLLWGIAIV